MTWTAHDAKWFILRKGDGLAERLSVATRGGGAVRAVRMSMQCTAAAGAGANAPTGDMFEIMPVRGQKERRAGAAGGARPAGKTRRRLARVRQGRQLCLPSLGLGIAALAAISAASLVSGSPPLGYVLTAGALASAGIMLARASG